MVSETLPVCRPFRNDTMMLFNNVHESHAEGELINWRGRESLSYCGNLFILFCSGEISIFNAALWNLGDMNSEHKSKRK